MKAVDYSFARFTAAQLKAAGVGVVFRYLRGAGKAITAAELATLLDGGIEVVLCDEMQATTATSGAPGGIVRGNAINLALHNLGLPVSTPVYAAADTEYEAITGPLAHFGSIAGIRGAGACGIYGEGELDEACRARGYCAFTWQSESRSYPGNATTARTTNVQQVTTTPPLVGTDLDLIELPGDFGQLPRPTDPPTPTEDTPMLSTSTRTDTKGETTMLDVYRENPDGSVQHWWQAQTGELAGKWEGPETLPGAVA